MKNMMFAVIAALLFVGCATLPPTTTSNLSNILDYTSSLHYINTYKTIETAQTPQQTMSLGSGNCIDLSLLFQYLAKQAGYTVKLVGIEKGSQRHMVCSNGIYYYDATTGERYITLPAGWHETSIY